MQKQRALQFPQQVKKGHATVKIYKVKNRDRTHYCVSYVAAGGRKRRNFADLESARREANTIAHNLMAGDLEALKITGQQKQMFVAADQAIQGTGLTLDVAAREFAKAFEILGHDGVIEAARYYKASVETGLPDVPVSTAVQKFAEAKRMEGMSSAYLKDIRTILGRFASQFNCNLASIDTEDLRDYLNALKIGPVAKNNHRRLIVVLFNFAKNQGWLRDERTAADGLGTYKVKQEEVSIYTPREVSKLLSAADEDFLPYLVLIAFGGVRREELHRGLAWEDVDFGRRTILIPAAIAKTGRKRKIVIADNLAEWLAPYRRKRGPIFERDPRKRMARVSQRSRVKWLPNALRHSFGSYRMEQTKNAGQVALEMGNSPAVVMTHYFEIVDANAASEYWSIRPLSKKSRKIIRFR